jgi:hypothetical protein
MGLRWESCFWAMPISFRLRLQVGLPGLVAVRLEAKAPTELLGRDCCAHVAQAKRARCDPASRAKDRVAGRRSGHIRRSGPF